jgi:mercuric ion transport protein
VRYLMAAVAVVTCPCHLPLLIVALSGTALGAVLFEHWGWTVLAFTALFVGSAWAAVRLFSKTGSPPAREKVPQR